MEKDIQREPQSDATEQAKPMAMPKRPDHILSAGFLAVCAAVGSVAIGTGVAATSKKLFTKTSFAESYQHMMSGSGKWVNGSIALITALPIFAGLRGIFNGNQRRIDENILLKQENTVLRDQLSTEGKQPNQMPSGTHTPTDTVTELAHTQQALTNVSHELEVVTNHAAKLSAPAESHAEQAAIDKAAAEQAAATIH